jgi:hypothetical protein
MFKYKLTDLYKQIKEEATEAPQSQYKIYCDLDGVLTDFEKRFEDLNPEHLKTRDYTAKYGTKKFWDFIDSEIGTEFWSGMSWMPDGKQLWEYISKYNPILLSAPSKNNESRLGKRIWVKNNINTKDKTPKTQLILTSAKTKQNYSRGNRILIDDRVDNVEQWRSQGGIGILHKNTADTIKQLQQYGL